MPELTADVVLYACYSLLLLWMACRMCVEHYRTRDEIEHARKLAELMARREALLLEGRMLRMMVWQESEAPEAREVLRAAKDGNNGTE